MTKSLLTKPCIECRIDNELSEFYSHPGMRDGTVNVCKACHKLRMKKRRMENPCVQEYDRIRSRRPDRKERARIVTINWRKNNPDKYKAETAVGNALRDGKISKQPCKVCGVEKNLHAHHSDYSKPLEVIWLCALHHHRLHAEIKVELNE